MPAPRARRPAALLVPLAAVVLAAGCGGSGAGEEQRVRDTVMAYARAVAAKDYPKLCGELLAARLVEASERIGLPCEEALRRAYGGVRDPQLVIGGVRVEGDRAEADVHTSATGEAPARDTLVLVKSDDDRWRIADPHAAG